MLNPRVLAVALLAALGAGAAALAVPAAPVPASEPLVSGAVVAKEPATLDTRAENRRAGAKSWRIPASLGKAAGLSAYAGAVSVRPGDPVPLVVSGSGPVSVRAFRVGWYGGDRARQIWRGTLQAHLQSGAPSTWQASGWADTKGWPAGHYLLRLDAAAASRYVPLTIRSGSARGRVLVLTSPISWQVTNKNSVDGSPLAPSGTVTFDRPYSGGYGAGGFLTDDAGVVQIAERTGRKLAYATDLDIAEDPSLLAGATAVVIGGDSRYWSAAGRKALIGAVDAGTNLAFFGAGTGSRTVALADSGRSLKVSSKPVTSVRLTGQQPACSPAAPLDWTVANNAWWGYRGTGLATGAVVTGLVGDGTDRAVTTAAGSPVPVQVVAFTKTAACPASSSVYWTNDAGAGVFAAGTGRWGCALTATCAKTKQTRAFVEQVTDNVVAAFAKPKAGQQYPPRNSASQYAALR